MNIEQWLGENNQLGIDIWKNKYQFNGETFDEWLDRVSNYDNDIKRLIIEKKFLFGGRILANRGLDKKGRKVTYSNCYVLPQVEDSIEDIYKTCSDLARTFSYGGGVGIDISKLRPVNAFVNNTARKTSGACSFMDTFSQVTETIGQNGRRGALMISIDCTHPELLEFIEIKNDLNKVTKANISVRITNDFMIAVENDEDWELYFKTEHEEIRKTVKAKDVFKLLCYNNWNMAEPGILFWDRIKDFNILSEDENFKYDGVNPCFTGDMRLLTTEGFKTFKELCDTEPMIVSYDGQISKGKVWCNGEKDTIELIMSNNDIIKCTPNHRFMTIDGDECEAKELKGLKIMPSIYNTNKIDNLYVKLGFIQGDGQLSRLNSETHKGLEVNIGYKDGDIRDLFENDSYTEKSNRAIYLNGYNELLEELGFSRTILPFRGFPKDYINWDLNKKASFLQGCYSANGCVNAKTRVSYKTTCREFAEQLIETLESDFGITPNLTINKKHQAKFDNGEYECRESYDVNINKYNDIIIFAQNIGFYQNYKKIKLINMIREKVPYVRNIRKGVPQLVYDFKEPINHWGIVEGYVAHNCAEEPLPAGGSCLLGSINLSEYVIDGIFDFEEFKEDIHIIVRAMNNVLDQGLPLHPLAIQKETVRDWRQIGIGIMGLADMLIKMGIRYDSERALDLCNNIGFDLANESLLASSLLAKEQGTYPLYNKDSVLASDYILYNTADETYETIKEYGLRNSQILTIAPTGTLSTMLGISGGIEPIFSLSYTRKTESLHGEDVYYKVYTPIAKEYMDKHGLKEEEELPYFFVTAQTLNPFKRVEMQGVWQSRIDASISSTVNLPNSATVEEVEQLYIHAWKNGLKGMTIYRDGCARSGVLTLENDNKEEKVEETNELKRGEWEQKPLGVIEIPRKIYTGCGKELLHITISPKEKRIIDFYITSSSTGGCKMNIQALAISMSAILRLGGNVNNIKCAFRGLGGCPSYTTARAKGKKVSKGVSCPTAILNVLLEVQQQLENETLLELQELGYYDNKNNIEEEKVIEGAKFSFTPIDLNNRPKFTNEELKFIEEYGESAYSQRYGKCPICNDKIDHVGGCVQCNSCGWSKCS